MTDLGQHVFVLPESGCQLGITVYGVHEALGFVRAPQDPTGQREAEFFAKHGKMPLGELVAKLDDLEAERDRTWEAVATILESIDQFWVDEETGENCHGCGICDDTVEGCANHDCPAPTIRADLAAYRKQETPKV